MGTEDDLLENIWGDFLIESDRRSSDMWYSYILGDLGSTKYDQYLEASDKCIVTDSEIGILIYHGIEQYVELYKNREEFIIDLMCVNTTYDTVILRQMWEIITKLKDICETDYNTIYYIIYGTLPLEYVEKIQKGSLNIKLHELKDIKNKNSLCNLYSLYCNINHIYNSLIDSDIEEMIPIINKETIDKLEIYNKGIFNYDKIKSNTYYGIININARYRIKGNNKLDTVKEMIDNIKRWVSVKDRYSIDSVFMNLY